MTYFNDIRSNHRRFNISGEGNKTKTLEKEEYIFRVGAMYEELMEYANAVFDMPEGYNDPDAMRQDFTDFLKGIELRKDVGSDKQLAEQLDAQVDLVTFAIGTAERQDFPFNEAWSTVQNANRNKELASKPSDSKRDFQLDLVKPEGWQAPDLVSLVAKPKGIIVLEGPDGTGKTSLANHLIEEHDAAYIHRTWSPQLECDMYNYIMESVQEAIKLSKEKVVILDRSWISEFIYSDLFRDGTNWPELAHDAYKKLNNANAFYLFCIPYSNSSVAKYLREFEILKNEREEMYDSMRDCYEAFSTFVFGKNGDFQYDFNSKCTFLNLYWPENLTAFEGLDGCVYDRFLDSDYVEITEIVNNHLRRSK